MLWLGDIFLYNQNIFNNLLKKIKKMDKSIDELNYFLNTFMS